MRSLLGRIPRIYRIDVLGAVFCLAALLPLLLPYVNPLLRPRPCAAQQQKRLSQLRRDVTRLSNGLARGKRRLAELTETLASRQVALSPPDRINARVGELARLAEEAGLSIDELLPGAPSRRPLCSEVPIQLKGRGSYPTCATFLAALSRRFPDTAVRSFELTARPQRDDAPAEFSASLIWHAAHPGAEPDDD